MPQRLPDRIRLPLDFDAARLRAAVAAFGADDWIAHHVRQNYAGRWDVLPLRAPRGATHPILMIAPHPGMEDFADTALLGKAPYLAEVLAAFRCPLHTVRLMRLAPGSAIREHCDPDLDADTGVARIHVPVTTSDAVAFLLNGRRVDMAPGSAWYLRLSDPHAVRNAGDSPRVHLVIDARVNAWLRARLAHGAQATSPSA